MQGRQTKLHPDLTRKKHKNHVFGRTYPRSAGGAKAEFCQIKDVSSSKILEPTPPVIIEWCPLTEALAYALASHATNTISITSIINAVAIVAMTTGVPYSRFIAHTVDSVTENKWNSPVNSGRAANFDKLVGIWYDFGCYEL